MLSMMHYAPAERKCHLHQPVRYAFCMGTPEERLREARAKSGFGSAKSAAEAMGVPVATYIQHENGARGYGLRAERYARFFRVTPEWLLYGRGKGDPAPAETRAISEVRRLAERPIDFLSDAPKM